MLSICIMSPSNVTWTDVCETAFAKLKQRLTTCPVLKGPDLSQPFVLQTDASEWGIGAVLSQYRPDGEEHPVAYYSRKLLPQEERYRTVEKECLAIKLGVQAFCVYLLGKPFIIQTDGPQILGVVPPPEGKQLQAYALEAGLTAILFYCGASKRKGQR